MAEEYEFSEDEALREESSLEVENSDKPFSDYVPIKKLIEESTLQQLKWILE